MDGICRSPGGGNSLGGEEPSELSSIILEDRTMKNEKVADWSRFKFHGVVLLIKLTDSGLCDPDARIRGKILNQCGKLWGYVPWQYQNISGIT